MSVSCVNFTSLLQIFVLILNSLDHTAEKLNVRLSCRPLVDRLQFNCVIFGKVLIHYVVWKPSKLIRIIGASMIIDLLSLLRSSYGVRMIALCRVLIQIGRLDRLIFGFNNLR